jgi:cysteine desulfurase/selenocysteine lyase
VPHQVTDVQRLGVDFLCFSGHKLYGPTGVGILYGRRDRLEEMEPFLYGGHMIERVYRDRSTWAPLPAKLEAGTIPIVQAIGLGAAIEYVERLGLTHLHAHEQELLAYAHRQLTGLAGLRIYGPGLEQRGAILSFTMAGAHPEDLAQLLDRRGVFVRHGHHCTMPLHDWLGVPATVRASFGCYNMLEEVDALVDALDFARDRLRLK